MQGNDAAVLVPPGHLTKAQHAEPSQFGVGRAVVAVEREVIGTAGLADLQDQQRWLGAGWPRQDVRIEADLDDHPVGAHEMCTERRGGQYEPVRQQERAVSKNA